MHINVVNDALIIKTMRKAFKHDEQIGLCLFCGNESPTEWDTVADPCHKCGSTTGLAGALELAESLRGDAS
jgi:hypothetical protein